MKTKYAIVCAIVASMGMGMAAHGQNYLFDENFENPTADSQEFNTSGTVQFSAGGVEVQPGASLYLKSAYAFNDTGSVPIYYSITYDFTGIGTTNYALFSFRLAAGATSGGYEVLNSLYNNNAEFAIGQDFTPPDDGFYFEGIGSPPNGTLPPVLYTTGPFTITTELLNTTFDGEPATDMNVYLNGTEILSGAGYNAGSIRSGASLGFSNSGTEAADISNIAVYTAPEPSAGALLLLGGTLAAAGRFIFCRNKTPAR